MLKRFGILLILALAFALRIIGIGWGLPNESRVESLHPDEPIVALVAGSLDPLAGKFDPGFYNYGTLYLSVSRLVAPPATPETVGHYRSRLLNMRFVNAFAGVASVAVLYVLLRRRSQAAALAGSAILAIAPGFVVHSKFATVDVFATFLVISCLAVADKLLDESVRAEKFAAAAGLLAGLAGGTKYNFILVSVAVFVAIGMSQRANRLFLGLLAVATTVVGFLVATPGLILNPARFRQDFLYELKHTAEGHGLVFAGRPPGFLTHISNLSEGVGAVLCLLGVLGMGYGLWASRRNPTLRWFWPIAVFGVLYYLAIGRAQVAFLRYTFPLIPVLAIGTAVLFDLREKLSAAGQRFLVTLYLLGLGGFGGGGLSTAVEQAAWMAGDDPRDQAGTWLKQQGHGKTVGLASDPWFYSPTLYPEMQVHRGVFAAQGEALLAASQNPHVTRGTTPWSERYDFEPSVFDQGCDFIALSSFEIFDYTRLDDAKLTVNELLQSRYRSFMDRLNKDYSLVKLFGSGGPTTHDLMYIRPTILVYKRKAP